jgi:diguanylate cyclase (GGDEF)-like protein/PAS domain S-box-containing protein
MAATIFVIDDSEDDLLLYRRALKDRGYVLETAQTAAEGFARAVELSPELILLDYNLPDSDGIELLQRLLEHFSSRVPIVMLTGEGNTAVAVEVMKLGAADYLVKDVAGEYLRRLPDVARYVLEAHEHKMRAAELRRVTEKLLQRNQALLQNSTEAVLILDEAGNLVEVNGAFCKMLGYTEEEALRLNASDLNEHWQELVDHGAQLETKCRRKDGSFANVECTTSGIRFEGAAYHYVACRDIAERKQKEALLARYRHVIETAIDGFWVADLYGYILEANEAYAAMSGYTTEELYGMHISHLDAFDRPDDVKARGLRIVENGFERFETQHRRKDGQLVDIAVSARYMPESKQFAVFCRDITARKRAAAAVAQSEASLRAILDNAPHLTWLKDRDGRYVKINRGFADFLRLKDAREAEGKNDYELNPAELAEKYRQDDAEVMATRQRKHVEEEAFDGKRRFWIETWKTPIVNEAGEVIGTAGFAGDITERKEAEEALRIAAATFETHDAIVITDTNANIVRVNQAFTEITGYTQDEVIGKNPRVMSSGRQDRAFYTEMWQQLLHAGSWAGEIMDRRKNGQVYPKWLTITAVKNAQQEITHYVGIFSDITARKQAEEEIRNLAFYDVLTKLPNRRLFMDRFRAALTISARHNDFGAVLFIDLDRFKLLNDSMGHDYGDLMLIEVAHRIKACVREMDTVARLGGDEFVVLLEGISRTQEEALHHVVIVSEKIREALAQPYQLKSIEHHSSPSIGISLYRGHEATVDELLQKADLAMYQAKSTGRNTVRFFDPVMQHNVSMRAELENDLHHAIALGQLELYYQAQMDGNNRPLGAEALLRWHHPARGIVPPAQFIPIAEESPLIIEIGDWVMDNACRQLALWGAVLPLKEMALSVNVSARQFAQPDFVSKVTQCLLRHGVASQCLRLELTESLVLSDLASTIGKMHALKALGVKLSLDDFGTGYSSLSYLKYLPLDQIKIDKSFVHGISLGGNDALLVKTIIDMAENFCMDVVAEGVETASQLEFLKGRKCPAFQGFLFSTPLPAAEFEALLAKAAAGQESR